MPEHSVREPPPNTVKIIKNNKKIQNKINKLINQQQESARDQESTLKELKKLDKTPEPETPRRQKTPNENKPVDK